MGNIKHFKIDEQRATSGGLTNGMLWVNVCVYFYLLERGGVCVSISGAINK